MENHGKSWKIMENHGKTGGMTQREQPVRNLPGNQGVMGNACVLIGRFY